MAEAKRINPEVTAPEVAEEIKSTTEEIVAETKEEMKEAPSRLRELEVLWDRTSVQFFHVPKN